MELQHIIDAQKELDARIIKEKGLEGQDLVANTFVALQVELGEMANEARWFKHWSKNRDPRNKDIECHACRGKGDFTVDLHTRKKEPCTYCEGTGIQQRNPLLMEFVDSVHFFVSVAIQKGWEDALWIYEEQIDPGEFDGDLTGYYLEMMYFLNLASTRNYTEEEDAKCEDALGFKRNQYNFRTAWILFLNIGMNGFGFTWEQIYEAYFEKNKVNHRRQDSGVY